MSTSYVDVLCCDCTMEIKLRLFAAVQLLLSWLLIPYYFIVDLLPVTYCPKIKDDVLLLSITELAAKIRKGELKSSKVVKAYIARIKEVNPILNAITDERFVEAIQEAEAVDKLLESNTKSVELIEKDTPLLGVPITVKESCQVKGLSFTVGSLPRKGLVGTTDGAAVKLVRGAGAVVLCVTNTPELCLSWDCQNLVTGATCNSYNPRRTSGGSSGGEGALIGAAASPGGIGSDIGGSVRVPALFNGIFGHKPTPGYVLLDGHFPREPSYDNFLSIGPLVRYAGDLPLMMRTLTTPNMVDKLRLELPVDLRKLNVFYQESAGFSLVTVGVDPDIKAAHRNAVSFFKKIGCETHKTDIPELIDSIEISAACMLKIEGMPDLLATSKKKSKEQHSLFGEMAKTLLNMSEFSLNGLLFAFLLENKFMIPQKRREYYENKAQKLKSHFIEILGENGVFLYPTFPVPAFHHNEFLNKTASIVYPIIFNALGLPATNVTMGLGRSNLPVGIQVIAAPHQDRLCFAVARALEQEYGGWVPPPSTS